MRPRLLGPAAAVLSAAFATAADPVLPPTAPDARPTVTGSADARLPGPHRSGASQPPLFPSGTRPTATRQPETPPTAPPPREAGSPATPGPMPAVPGAAGFDPCAPCPPAQVPGVVDDRLGPWNTVWVRGGPMLLWIKDAPVGPPILATGPLGPGNRVLLGANQIGYDGFGGGWLETGMWLNPRHTIGLGVSGFMTEKRATRSAVASDPGGSPLLARPFFNPQLVGLGGQDALLVSDPGRYAGALAIESGARLAGGEVNGLFNVAATDTWTANLIGGFRYFDLDEYLNVTQFTRGLNGNPVPFFGVPGGVPEVVVTDRVRTRNQFFGGQVGGEAEYRLGPGFVNIGTKVGFGPVHQVTEVTGQTTGPGGAGGPGGFLAVGAIPAGNIGRTVTNRFSVLSDTYGSVGVYVTRRVRLGVGYEFLYLTSVARPGRQVISTIDPRLIPTASAFGGRIPAPDASGLSVPPQTPFDRDDFFAHGVRLLFEVLY